MKRLLMVVGLVFALPAAANASAIKGVKYPDNGRAPVVITDGYVGIYDSLSGEPNLLVDTCLTYTDRSAKAISAVRFKYTYFNTFGEKLGSEMLSDTDVHEPGASDALAGRSEVFEQTPYTHCWRVANKHGDDIDHVIITVDTVKFVGGSIWRA